MMIMMTAIFWVACVLFVDWCFANDLASTSLVASPVRRRLSKLFAPFFLLFVLLAGSLPQHFFPRED